MDRIVYGISAISFHHYNEETNENCAPNHCMPTISSDSRASIAIASDEVLDFNCLPPVVNSHFQALAMSTSQCASVKLPTNAIGLNKNDTEEQHHESDKDLDSSAETVAADDDCSGSSSTYMGTRRRLPMRASKESSFLSKTKRRSIMKPTKRMGKTIGDITSLRPADIKKIYLNKKITNFHPAKLETIFEEPQPNTLSSDSQIRLIGARKLKRSLSCCDGLNTNKTLIKQRRLKIKKTFGRRFALKKISLDDFLHRLNRSFDSTEIEEEEVNAGKIPKTEDEQTTTTEAMDADEYKEEVSDLTTEEVSAKLLLPTPDGGVLIKSNSFSSGSAVSTKHMNIDAKIVLS